MKKENAAEKSAQESNNCSEPCTDSKVSCPQFNQRNVQKFVDELSAATPEQQRKVLNEIEKEGVVGYLYNNFTVDRNFVKAIDAAPQFIIDQIQDSLMKGIPAGAEFNVSMPDFFTRARNGEGGSPALRIPTKITITITFGRISAGGTGEDPTGLVKWELFGGKA